jgi:glycosyltransferase involved in cell wall biosynthesis
MCVLSVVIACYNGATTLPVQLEALSTQEWSRSWEVVLADNGSTDGSAEIATGYAKKLPNMRMVDASACQGQPFALNTGIRASRGASIALCDADDEVAPGWLAGMGEALLQHDFVACTMDHVKLNPAWLQWPQQKTELQRLWYPPFLPHAGGATLGFKRTLYDDLGGFDERLRYLHDTEFCIRAELKGIRLTFVNTAVRSGLPSVRLGIMLKRMLFWPSAISRETRAPRNITEPSFESGRPWRATSDGRVRSTNVGLYGFGDWVCKSAD